jgi:hypothetical protein
MIFAPHQDLARPLGELAVKQTERAKTKTKLRSKKKKRAEKKSD